MPDSQRHDGVSRGSVTQYSWTSKFYPGTVRDYGSLANGEPFYRLELPDDVDHGMMPSGADGMTLDREGYLYSVTQPGRIVGTISYPHAEDASNLVFGGPDLQTLYCVGVSNWRLEDRFVEGLRLSDDDQIGRAHV